MGEYTRRIDLKIEIDTWDWTKGSITETLDVTKDILNYRFQKTIKTPKGTCQLSVLPQSADTHILDTISPMDVVKISEFGILKFVGYIQRVSYTGTINKDGTPNRNATITVGQFGGLLVDANVGLGLGTAMGKSDDLLYIAATVLYKNIANAVKDGVTFTELISLLVASFKTYLTNLEATNFLTYLDTYLDIETGLTPKKGGSTKKSLIPRTFEMYNGTENSLSFWSAAEQLVEKPFNEFWMDNGPRKVFIDGKSITLPDKSCFVFRETPFDGTIGGVSNKSFSNMESIYIDKNHFLRFDLARSMDEVYTAYVVKNAAYRFEDLARMLLGKWGIDKIRVGKYLFRPLITELFYTRMESIESVKVEVPIHTLEDVNQNATDTLKAWFENNDDYLSGALGMMVPSDPDADPKIGDKVSVYGIKGFFYVESVAHTWQYQGPLKSDLTVTRGYNENKRIELKDRIFKRNPIR